MENHLFSSYLAKTDILIMIYFLGGPPRVGKSIISGKIRRKYTISVVSTDSLGTVLESALNPESEPDLFVFAKFNEIPVPDRIKLMVENPTELIDYTVKESCIVWKAIEAFVGREKDEGRDVLIEGVAVLPELVSQLENIDYRVVFIGNQGKEHRKNIKEGTEANENDWMRFASDQYIGAFATFVVRMSAYIEQEAQKFGFKYIEVDKRPFRNVADTVVEFLGLQPR